jgi:Holliday junction DNA helicase RuvA
MIAYLKGQVIQLDPEFAVLDVNGVGYEVFCSSNSLGRLQQNTEAQLFIHTHVREDALVLYGFANKSEKDLFLSLLKVNGVGPKLAIKILSGTTIEHFLHMIEDGDVKGLSQLPKVGKKTAEQLILTLKGKLEFAEESTGPEKKSLGGPGRQIFSALVNLGFKETDVQKVVQEFAPDISFEEGVRKGLSTLTSL